MTSTPDDTTWRVNEHTEEPSARRAGWSHDWQPRWSHGLGRKPLRAVPCSWQATPPDGGSGNSSQSNWISYATAGNMRRAPRTVLKWGGARRRTCLSAPSRTQAGGDGARRVRGPTASGRGPRQGRTSPRRLHQDVVVRPDGHRVRVTRRRVGSPPPSVRSQSTTASESTSVPRVTATARAGWRRASTRWRNAGGRTLVDDLNSAQAQCSLNEFCARVGDARAPWTRGAPASGRWQRPSRLRRRRCPTRPRSSWTGSSRLRH